MAKYLLLFLISWNLHAKACFFTAEAHEGFESLDYIYIPISPHTDRLRLAVAFDTGSLHLNDLKVIDPANSNIQKFKCPKILKELEITIEDDLVRKLFLTDLLKDFTMILAKLHNVPHEKIEYVKDDDKHYFYIRVKK